MTFKQIWRCLPQYPRQSTDAAKTVQEMKEAFLQQQREAGHNVVECVDEALITAINYARVELTLAHALLGVGTARERTNARHRVQHALDELGGPITNTDEPKPYTGPVRKP